MRNSLSPEITYIFESTDFGNSVTTGGTYPVMASNRWKYNGKEVQTTGNVNWLDYGAREYDEVIARWTRPDPMSEKYYGTSGYTYSVDNPISLVDPNGNDISTDVIKLDNGKYEVVGGKADEDLNIYVVQNGKRTGEIIGQSLTEYSFLGDDGSAVKGAVINPNDLSGQSFIKNEIVRNNPNIINYALHATDKTSKNGTASKYNFKNRNLPDTKNSDIRARYNYRGMPLFTNKEGVKIYGSGRDVGNYGAGFGAGRIGMSWNTARLGFDALESRQRGKIAVEGQPTQQAEKSGFYSGKVQLILDIIDLLYWLITWQGLKNFCLQHLP